VQLTEFATALIGWESAYPMGHQRFFVDSVRPISPKQSSEDLVCFVNHGKVEGWGGTQNVEPRSLPANSRPIEWVHVD
jgi:hypothetical protein